MGEQANKRASAISHNAEKWENDVEYEFKIADVVLIQVSGDLISRDSYEEGKAGENIRLQLFQCLEDLLPR